MTDIRTCYIGQHPVKGLVSHGKIVALIVDAALVDVLGVTPNMVKPPWEQKLHNGVIICARFNGVDYDLAATSNVEYADAVFARTGWKGDIDFVRTMKTYRPFEY